MEQVRTDSDTGSSWDRIITAARAGEPRALECVRNWPRLEAASEERDFSVNVQTLSDPAVSGPRRRREVFVPFTPFSGDEFVRRGVSTQDACDSVRACPPLERFLQFKALGHMSSLERRLFLDDELDARGRKKIGRELQLLAAPGEPIWQNWVDMTPWSHHEQFDGLIRRWMSSPVDLSEQQFFIDNWRDRHWSASAAGEFCDLLGTQLRLFLGIKLVRDMADGIGFCIARLEADPAQATRWAESIGLKLRFDAGATLQPSTSSTAKEMSGPWRAASGR
ncbi:hypothetical protein EZ313_17835 [Ramlibacter henchirensis]|uniref:Uncharacterized protein n=1 Tax=Ramlibacter henchirensis TaxID=204072 RepID=A0A4Z0BX49_9BURK|nr:hypothetical protein [Ramlibacter henchirensis]TFZ03074.1 hypothetical protein EZ313_17835 [Ramlibacter henchirensis]